MTEKEIQSLGFKLQTINQHEPAHYYTCTIARGHKFISNNSDTIYGDDQWHVDFFNSDPVIRFTEFNKLQTLIHLLKSHEYIPEML